MNVKALKQTIVILTLSVQILKDLMFVDAAVVIRVMGETAQV